jgi:hypothetical protein
MGLFSGAVDTELHGRLGSQPDLTASRFLASSQLAK